MLRVFFLRFFFSFFITLQSYVNAKLDNSFKTQKHSLHKPTTPDEGL